ncbi:MAG: cytochrome P450 [Phenylobacterium sp.]|uniref:cytochrome P450 n=1 Tax=Phenylobacterium sp. TaxID=1871053 RepID=UPI0027369EF3|nr:cytochrome P450 [Phenylobacterium sp.]MDP3750001.1 cytochrome P450 [Phenylobacterium sp.]
MQALAETTGGNAADIPLDQLDVSEVQLYAQDSWRTPFARLRREAPVHFLSESPHGPFWSVTTHELITYVESHPEIFSSDFKYGGISIVDLYMQNFLSSDRPRHTEQRKVVAPAFSPSELLRMGAAIRKRTSERLDAIAIGETFDWVDNVSVELTTQMLAILFDFPWEDRRQLTEWSHWSRNVEAARDPEMSKVRDAHMHAMTTYFNGVWAEKKNQAPGTDLISRMAHSEAMGDLTWEEKLGNLALLIVGGNDTTRNSMSGMILAFNQFPEQWAKLRADPSLLDNAVPEIVRWQTPVLSMRRTCVENTELGGQQIKKGQKVVMWYISGNRDETVFEEPDRLIVDRENARQHVSFGFGIHRCLGSRLAELQIRILLEEMIRRRMVVELASEPVRPATLAGHGFETMPVRIRID